MLLKGAPKDAGEHAVVHGPGGAQAQRLQQELAQQLEQDLQSVAHSALRVADLALIFSDIWVLVWR